MAKEREELMHTIYEILWYMRGGLTKEDAWGLSQNERVSVLRDIKKRIETVEKTGLAIL